MPLFENTCLTSKVAPCDAVSELEAACSGTMATKSVAHPEDTEKNRKELAAKANVKPS